MNYLDINGTRWPVAEATDFETHDSGETFALFEDEDGGTYFGYGHIPADYFIAEVDRYNRHFCGDDFESIEWGTPVDHVYAVFTDRDGERFTWAGVTSETPHSFPMTKLWL